MRIKHYPGKAVDANYYTSTEQHHQNHHQQQSNGGMGAIYEANWLQAQESIKNPLKNGFDAISMQQSQRPQYPQSTGFVEGISALYKYQLSLEQVRTLDQQNKNVSLVNAIKDVNGYRPSTLRRKNRKQYPGWDDLKEAAEEIEKDDVSKSKEMTCSPVNHYISDPTDRGRPRQLTPQDHAKARPYSPPKNSVDNEPEVWTPRGLRRSQTVIIQTRGGSCGTLDIKDLRRKWKSKNEINMISRSNTLSNFKNSIEDHVSEDNYDDDDDTKTVKNEPIEQKSNYMFSLNNNTDCDNSKYGEFEDVYLKPKSRMDSYLPSDQTQKFSTVRSRPTLRTKSVRLKPVTLPPIDYLDSSETFESQKSPPITNKEGTEKNRKNSGIQEKTTNTKESPFSVFTLKKFKTIPLAKLLRSSDHGKTLPRKQQTSNVKHETLKKSEIPSSTLETKTAATSASVTNLDATNHDEQRRQPGSLSSSTNSNDDQFSIPRPRLIVPVHTYARKRRTGNLLKEVTIDPVKSGEKGK